MIGKLIREIKKFANPEKAAFVARFFKTGKGQYGEGDVFWGLSVPEQREIAKKFKGLTLPEIEKLLHHKVHEVRLTGLIILTKKFEKKEQQKAIVDLYLRNTKYINNWDLVDLSSHEILGTYFIDKDRAILYKLARSKNLWEKRIAVVATHAFIRNNEFADTLAIAELLLRDPCDLIHKAVGWMLREVGKRDQKVLEKFLTKHHTAMPRTTLRYAIERFDQKTKRFYLKKK